VNFKDLLTQIGAIHTRAQQEVGRSAQRIHTLHNWLIGAWLIEYEQAGEDRAAYGTQLIERLARGLMDAGLTGLSTSNLKNFRQVTLAYPGLDVERLPERIGPTAMLLAGRPVLPSDASSIRQTSGETGPSSIRQTSGETSPSSIHQTSGTSETSPSSPSPTVAKRPRLFPTLSLRAEQASELPWRDHAWIARLFTTLHFSHLLELSRVQAPLERAFYELHCLKEGWSVRELKRQRETLLYQRTGLSKDRDGLLALARKGMLKETPAAILRDPLVLEFLDLQAQPHFTETVLEQALLDHLQSFLLELGSDFCFMGRQYRITLGGRHHFLDLLFYHRGLRCLVAFDLKTEAFRHEHAGQMNFYANYLAEQVARSDENPPIGVILCTDKDAAEVHYATAGMEHSVFVSRYLVQLPSEETLARWLKEERALLESVVGRDRGPEDDTS